MMGLPFSREQFLEVFGAYNRALAGGAVALWLVSLLAAVALMRGWRDDRALALLLALHWAWAGIAYHAAFFSRINPAAPVFAGLFLVQAALFVRAAVPRPRLRFTWARDLRRGLAAALLGYALAYPILALLTGHRYPQTPTFGVPCPTALLTAGFLLAAETVPRGLVVVPVVWSAIGGSAAVLLGVAPDTMLFVGGALLLIHALRPAPPTPRTA